MSFSLVHFTIIIIIILIKHYTMIYNLCLHSAAQDGYLTEAQQYAQETDLSRRVRDWEDRILPVLSKEVNGKINYWILINTSTTCIQSD